MPTKNVFLDNLEVVEVDTSGVVGYDVSINKVDYSQVTEKEVSLNGGETKLPTWGIPELNAPKKCKQF